MLAHHVLGLTLFFSPAIAPNAAVETKGTDQPPVLSLAVKIPSSKYAVGDTVRADFTLTNGSAESASGCVRTWEGYTLEGPSDRDRRFALPLDAVSEARVFRLPPGMRLTWQVAVKIPPDIGIGVANLTGELESDDVGCPKGWHGKLASDPVSFRIVSGPRKR